MTCRLCRQNNPSCQRCSRRCQACGDASCDRVDCSKRVAIEQRPIWYAAAYDVDGSLTKWRGPMMWRAARRIAVELEREEFIGKTRVSRWMPTLKPWLRAA